MKLITHDGSFHADDVLAYAVLSGIGSMKQAELIRTRDQEVIARAGSSDIVFDVGFVFDPVNNRFDHHMKEKPLRQETHEGVPVPYSSVGLVWRFFGEEYLVDRFPGIGPAVDRVWAAVDKSLILPTDMTDNGIGVSFAPASLSVFIDDLNREWDDADEDGDELFLKASHMARDILDGRVRRIWAETRAFDLVCDTIASSPDPRIVVLPGAMPWEHAVHAGGFDEILYVVSEKKGTWYCQGVRTDEGSFEQRKPLPEAWAGLQGTALVSVSGVDDAVFCHSMRFVCAAASLEGVLSLARKAVDHDMSQSSP
ncbi:MYG1 family protein [Agrobacterium rubi]|nr:MYG1 family protein [Agrobacterium rubi]NTF24559.1 MYG1 family protein [Agrobacterium rubi]